MKKIRLAIILSIIVFCLYGCTEKKELFCFNEYEEFKYVKGYYSEEKFSPEKQTGERVFYGQAGTAERATQIAEDYFIKLFGEKQITRQRLYLVYYDKLNTVWKVEGNPEYLDGDAGGTALVIINEEDGEILTCFHSE